MGKMRVGPTAKIAVLRRQNIRFDQSVAGRTAFATHNGRGIPGGTHNDDG
jgi:hypothetical protein